jgi:hypothetical protein
MGKPFHVMHAAATPQPGYAIHYVEAYSFDLTIASQPGYLIFQNHHDFIPEDVTSPAVSKTNNEKKIDFPLFPIENSYGTIRFARAHSSVVRAAGS